MCGGKRVLSLVPYGTWSYGEMVPFFSPVRGRWGVGCGISGNPWGALWVVDSRLIRMVEFKIFCFIYILF